VDAEFESKWIAVSPRRIVSKRHDFELEDGEPYDFDDRVAAPR
jgi:hypothetical protein